jgi:hypothetical protein
MQLVLDLFYMPQSAFRRAVLATGSAAAGFAVFLLYHFDPTTTEVFPLCPFRYFTGYYCPGCGSLRALHQLLHGNVAAAFAYNPLAVLSVPLILYWCVSQAALLWRGRPLPSRFVPARWIWALLVLVLSFWVLRNVPAYPFSLLAPGALLR